ncbi:MAG: Hpt domain-containing protein, partial [Pirellulales bacterium]|nr:Hpt domain-containing protein [Pirellulales bacterium]
MNEHSFPDDLPTDEMGDYLRLYLDETNEQLDSLVEIFLQLENQAPTPEELNEAFRLIHSIKGSSALLGLDRITSLTHHLETHFEKLRSGKQELNTPTIDVVLRCIDFLRESNQHLQDGEPLSTAGDLLDQVKSLGQITPASNTPKTQQPAHLLQSTEQRKNNSSAQVQPPQHSAQEPEESWWSISISVEPGT